MCGIAGIVSRGAIDYRKHVQRMLDAMSHRGPDGKGLWCSPSGNCVLGHRRLAVLDLSDSAAQPMLDHAGNSLSYNGECYNYQEIRARLEKQGEMFASTGDTETIHRLLSRDGAGALSELNGMFALAFWDERGQRAILARDRFGQKPLYWTRFAGGILFASEVRAILASGLVERQLDPDGVIGFLSHGAVQGPGTILRNVYLLPRATQMIVPIGGEPETAAFWRPPEDICDVEDQNLRSEFADAVSRHLVSDAPLGIFLSGGVDSSAIAAAASHVRQVTSLSVTFPDHPEFSESDLARATARRIGADHVEVPVVDRDILDIVEQYSSCLDQPSVDGVNTYIVSRAARQAGLTVALSGLGSDELFGGYATYSRISRIPGVCSLLRPFPRLTQLAPSWASSDRRIAKIDDLLEAPNTWLAKYLNCRKVMPSAQLRLLMPGRFDRWIPGVPTGRVVELERLICGRGLANTVAQLELEIYMGQTLLRDSDCMGMANSLEIRVPFLDARFSNLVLRLPDNARKPRRGQRKWRLIDALGDWLPKESWSRPKRGFTLPWAGFLTGKLKGRVSESIDRLGQWNWFSAQALQDVWKGYLRSPERAGWSRIWALNTLSEYADRHALTLEESDSGEMQKSAA